MDETTTWNDTLGSDDPQRTLEEFPVLLTIYSPEGTVCTDSCRVVSPFTVGRSPDCDLTVHHGKISRHHFYLKKREKGFEIEDAGSKNGTYLMGGRLVEKQLLPNSAVIRAGESVFVFENEGRELVEPPPAIRFGMAGRFHVGPLIRRLREAAASSRHCLLAGPSGSGKEMAARALTAMMTEDGNRERCVLSHNAARFASEEEAATTLFGVASRVFSGVDARPGLIEEAGGGVLFLDEAHCLPTRIQKSLLRVIEEGTFARIGETKERPTDVRFVLSTNLPSPSYGLVHDLRARLRVASVPALSERIADIPSIFNSLLIQSGDDRSLDIAALSHAVGSRHLEQLMCHGFQEDNVRGLLDIVDRLTTRCRVGVAPRDAVSSVFREVFGTERVGVAVGFKGENTSDSHYEAFKEQILKAYHDCNFNISALERHLRNEQVTCSRRWLRHYLKEWGHYRER